MGELGDEDEVPCVCSLQCSVGDELALSVRRFWELEELPFATISLISDEQAVEDHFKTHRRLQDGRYAVSLPLFELLPTFRAVALRRFAL